MLSFLQYATGLGNVSLADNTLVPHQNISDPVQPGSDEIEWPPFYSVGIPIISILVFILTLVIVYMRPSRDPAAKEVEKSVATRYRNRVIILLPLFNSVKYISMISNELRKQMYYSFENTIFDLITAPALITAPP